MYPLSLSCCHARRIHRIIVKAVSAYESALFAECDIAFRMSSTVCLCRGAVALPMLRHVCVRE